MIDLGKTSVGETDVDWERMERGGDIPGAHDLYKVTYIRHLKNRGLSVTKLTQKMNGLFMTKKREFFSKKMGSFGGMYMKIWGVLTQTMGSLGDR